MRCASVSHESSLPQEKLLSAQSGSNQLYELLQTELKLRPADTYINHKLVQLYSADGRHEDAVKHCLAVEKTGVLRHCLEWYQLLVSTLQVQHRFLTGVVFSSFIFNPIKPTGAATLPFACLCLREIETETK